jgi:calmodulin
MANKFTEKEIQELKEAFKMFDKDNSGSISQNELKSTIKQMGFQCDDQQIDSLMKKLDSDNSGTINFNEFLDLIANFTDEGENMSDEQQKDRELKEIFNRFDINKDGYITSDELKITMKDLDEKATDEEINMMIKQADADGDGKVNYAGNT